MAESGGEAPPLPRRNIRFFAHSLNCQLVAVTPSENMLDAGLEACKPVIGDKRQRRTGKAAAVDTDSALALQQLLAQCDGERHILLLDVARRGHVLQQRP